MQVIDFSKKYDIPKGCGNHAEIFPRNIFCVNSWFHGLWQNQSDGQFATPGKQN